MEVRLVRRSVSYVEIWVETMYLKFLGQYEYVTTIFIVITCIFPDIADFFRKRVPALQECRPCRRLSTLDPLHSLPDTFERNWVLYDLIVIYKSSGGEMDERGKDRLIPVPNDQQARVP